MSRASAAPSSSEQSFLSPAKPLPCAKSGAPTMHDALFGAPIPVQPLGHGSSWPGSHMGWKFCQLKALPRRFYPHFVDTPSRYIQLQVKLSQRPL
eukprot:COSAG01_NODE_1331_length_10699_cov_28.574717_6_plen_95_part_00